MASTSAYEKLRERNIARNNRILTELGLAKGKGLIQVQAKREPTKKRKRRHASTRQSAKSIRRSHRLLGTQPVAQQINHNRDSSSHRDPKVTKREQIAEGWRTKNGRWRGECFGHVSGVPVGTVFGAGDYQRKGRFEMSANGFFAPRVTPEWIDRETKAVFSLVFNNDNGNSADSFDVLQYAGAGGRRRGQNRTAAQSFHQTWKSATNAALRENFRLKLPVRVIRGPKALGFGTAAHGGGYRYDGLYSVIKAELVPSGPRKLRTALFTLQKLGTKDHSSLPAPRSEGGGGRKGTAPTRKGKSPRDTKIGDMVADQASARSSRSRNLGIDCNTLKRKIWTNFRAACRHYKFPGSYQVGSYGPKGEGMLRTYSNSTPGKDKVLSGGEVVLYRLKDEKCRAQFAVNRDRRKPVKVFRKVAKGVMELGDFFVESFVNADHDDHIEKFGSEFVRFVRIGTV